MIHENVNVSKKITSDLIVLAALPIPINPHHVKYNSLHLNLLQTYQNPGYCSRYTQRDQYRYKDPVFTRRCVRIRSVGVKEMDTLLRHVRCLRRWHVIKRSNHIQFLERDYMREPHTRQQQVYRHMWVTTQRSTMGLRFLQKWLVMPGKLPRGNRISVSRVGKGTTRVPTRCYHNYCEQNYHPAARMP